MEMVYNSVYKTVQSMKENTSVALKMSDHKLTRPLTLYGHGKDVKGLTIHSGNMAFLLHLFMHPILYDLLLFDFRKCIEFLYSI